MTSRNEYLRQWRAENPDSGKNASRDWRKAHPEYMRQKSREWRRAHPGYIAPNKGGKGVKVKHERVTRNCDGVTYKFDKVQKIIGGDCLVPMQIQHLSGMKLEQAIVEIIRAR
jgi:hypothetical protein